MGQAFILREMFPEGAFQRLEYVSLSRSFLSLVSLSLITSALMESWRTTSMMVEATRDNKLLSIQIDEEITV